MNIVDVHNSVKLSLSVSAHIYSGDKDNCNLRNGKGTEVWKSPNCQQSYTGFFLQNCLHNIGTYKWEINNERYTYEGKLYANYLEGYGLLSYPDHRTYEGLFLSNRRFGPGILTYSNGKQDVGLWDGVNLVRLNQTLPGKCVPELARSSEGKAYLLQYKKLVPICDKYQTTAHDMLVQLGANEDVLKKSDKLYSKFVRNPNSVFFNQKLYYDSYFTDDIDFTIDVVESTEADGTPIVKQITVTNLLTWNNDELAVSIMKHTFRHRSHEKLLSYQVSNVLTGQRDLFREPGQQETACLNLLEGCCSDNDVTVTKLICEHDLYPDLSDSLGNSGLIYASSNDQINVIKTLVNFGVNINHLNDECLTSLSLCMLRYIALKFDVVDWETAFLPSITSKQKAPEVQEWRVDLHSNLPDKPSHENKAQTFIFDLHCVHPNKVKKSKKGMKEKKPKNEKKVKTTDKKKKKDKKDGVDTSNPEADNKKEPLEKIFNTIIVLLQSGANTNFGEVPFPPLILSLFTRNMDLVLKMIQYGADCNIRTSWHDGYLTPLHIISSLPPAAELSCMAKVLLENGANPNYSANTNHWLEEKQILLAGTEIDDFGKTPLHLLCMRYDFDEDNANCLGELFSVLVSYGANLKDMYLGHTALSLAILRGNIKLIHCILGSGVVDPNEALGNNMGVPLTVLILKRYKNILPLDLCESVYNTLLEYYANPLKNVPKFEGNAVEFCVEEHKTKEAKKDTGKKKKNPKEKISKKKGENEQVIQILYDCAEKTLVKHIQGCVVKSIYEYKIECGIHDPIFDAIVKFINIQDTVSILQALIDKDEIYPSKRFCYELFQFVGSQTKKGMNIQANKRGSSKKSVTIQPAAEDLVDLLDFDKTAIRQKVFQFELTMPELDHDEENYKVCFECFQKKKKELILCPKCEIVYFCSQKCNIANNKKKTTKHPCKITFYDSEMKKMLERLAKGDTIDKTNIFDRFKSYREQLIESTSNYLEKLKLVDDFDEKIGSKAVRAERKNALDKGKKKGKKEKGDKAMEGKAKSRESRKTTTEFRNSDLKSRSRSIPKSKSRSRDKKKVRSRDRTGSEDSRSKKGKKLEKGQSRRKSKHTSKSKNNRDKSSKSRSKSKTSKQKGESRGKDKSKGGKKVGRDRSPQPADRKGRKASPDKFGKGIRDTVDSRQGRKLELVDKDAIKRQDYSSHPDRLKGGPRVEGVDVVGGRGHRMKEGFITDDYRTLISDVCGIFDVKFFQMFMPYCVFVDGQLYYKFNDSNAFYKLTYSNV